MNRFTIISCMLAAGALSSGAVTVGSPDGRLVLNLESTGATPVYSINYDGKTIIEPSPLGFDSNLGDFSKGFNLVSSKVDTVHRVFSQDKLKKKNIDYKATRLRADFTGPDKHKFSMEWEVADNDVAFRYLIPRQGDTGAMIIEGEATGYRFPTASTAFVTPQSDPMIGWKRTKPSYEEFYSVDAPLDSVSQYGHGYTFPALFRIGDDGWALLSETGVDGYYCASHLSDWKDGLYTIAYPMPGENNGNGNANAAISLPGKTPWRTITIGANLKPIVETTAPWNVVEPRYTVSRPAQPGRGTWSWLLWQDNSINTEDQRKFIDLASAMGFENVLIDNWWDNNIGRKGMEELIAYAHSKNVNPILWYSSSGYWNDIEQSPINHMDRPIVRKKEMKWLRDNSVRAIKVDFFGGDKQETIRLYEDILSDAADYGIDVVFHGCTLPRGWERMYPNFVGSEAVLASENLVFGQNFCDMEAFHATLHPFIRNSVAIMEYGGTVLNKRFNRGNDGGTRRVTGDAFQLATSILFQNPVQNFALAPNNLTDAPADAIEFMKAVPTTWDDTEFIDGYPGRYVVLARKHKGTWYIAGVNAEDKPLKLRLDLAGLGLRNADAELYIDSRDLKFGKSSLKIKDASAVPVEIAPDGGFVIVAK